MTRHRSKYLAVTTVVVVISLALFILWRPAGRQYVFEDAGFWMDRGIIQQLSRLGIALSSGNLSDPEFGPSELNLVLHNPSSDSLDMPRLLSRVRGGCIVAEFLNEAERGKDDYLITNGFYAFIKKLPQISAGASIEVPLSFVHAVPDPANPSRFIERNATSEDLRKSILNGVYKVVDVSLFEGEPGDVNVQEPIYSMHRLRLATYSLTTMTSQRELGPVFYADFLAPSVQPASTLRVFPDANPSNTVNSK